MTRYLLPVGLLCLLPGCEWLNQNLGWGPGRPGADVQRPDDTTWWGQVDTGSRNDSWGPRINGINVDCTDRGGVSELDIHVVLGGWAELVTLDMVASSTDDRVESFQLPTEANIDFCADGSCDEWMWSFQSAAVYEPDADETTLDCMDFSTAQTGLFTHSALRITVLPDDTNWGPQCAIWGHRSRELFGDDCECFDAFLADPPADPCGDHQSAQ